MRRIIQGEASLKVRPTCGKFPEAKTRHSDATRADHLHGDIAGGVAQLSKVHSEPSRPLQIGSGPMVVKLAGESRQQRARPVQRQRELLCAGVYLAQRPSRGLQ